MHYKSTFVFRALLCSLGLLTVSAIRPASGDPAISAAFPSPSTTPVSAPLPKMVPGASPASTEANPGAAAVPANPDVAPAPQSTVSQPAPSAQSAPAAPSSSAAATPAPVRRQRKGPSEYDLPLDINSEASKHLTTTPVYINLAIKHHNNNTVTFLGVYPYPVQPPKHRVPIKPLDTNIKTMKTLIDTTAYTKHLQRTIAYPTGGWRWQNAYHAALARSGQTEPHVLASMYLFSRALLPYVYEEVKKSNEVEEKRQARYDAAMDDYNNIKADAETEATRRGLEPRLVKYKKYFENGDRQGTANLAAGQWWVLATHKVPGLTFYWQQPITVHEGEPLVVTLNEDNALMVEGAW